LGAVAMGQRVRFWAMVKRFDDGFCHASLLDPFSGIATDANWPTARRKLQQVIRNRASRWPSVWWTQARSLEPPTHRELAITLEPPEPRSPNWTSAIPLTFDLFTWSITPTQCLLRIPAADVTILAKATELSDELIESHLRAGLARHLPTLEVATLVDHLAARSYRVELVEEVDPMELVRRIKNQPLQGKTKKPVHLPKVASEIRHWQWDAVHEVDHWLDALDDRLLGDRPASLLLVGPPGVGKTSLVYRWAQTRLADGSSAGRLRTAWATSGARLVSGMTGFGMWQERCRQIIAEAKQLRAMLHVGSLLELIEAGKINQQPGVASMMRAAIDQGDLVAIAECTPEQITILQREDPLLLRTFLRLDITEPDELTAQRILQQASDDFATDASSTGRPATLFTQEAIVELERLHRRFATYSAMPGAPLGFLKRMVFSATQESVYSAEDVARQFSKETGLPSFLFDDQATFDPDAIERQLGSELIGQHEPVRRITALLTLLKARLTRGDRPLVSLLFIGPTGVGKTEMAKALARLLYRDASRLLRLDLSEYASPAAAIRLIGMPGEGDGTLTSPIREQPFSIVLLDEFEKADPAVLDLLLQVLGEGRLTDASGRFADFRNAVIILTSNLGAETFRSSGFGFSASSGNDAAEHFQREVRRFVRPELLGRLDGIIPFYPLDATSLARIGRRELEAIGQRPGIRYGKTPIDFSDAVIGWIVGKSDQPELGARPLRRTIERHFVNPLADAISKRKTDAMATARIDVADRDQLKISFSTVAPADQTNAELDQCNQLDGYRSLRARAQCLAISMPRRKLDNQIERMERQLIAMKRKAKKQLKKNSPYALAAIANVTQQLDELLALRTETDRVIDQSMNVHRLAMQRWYSNTTVDPFEGDPSSRPLELSEKLTAILRRLHAIDSDQKPSTMTMILVSDRIMLAEWLLAGYHALFNERSKSWKWSTFFLKPYDPLLDSNSAEFARWQSIHHRSLPLDPKQCPSFRLLGNPPGEAAEKRKVVDVYRCESNAISWNSLPNRLGGIALQVTMDPFDAWVSDEEGVHVFHVPEGSGSKRYRIHLLVFPGPLIQWEPRTTWLESPEPQGPEVSRSYRLDTDQIFTLVEGGSSGFNTWSNAPDIKLSYLIDHEQRQRHWNRIGFEDNTLLTPTRLPVFEKADDEP
jgi:ATP-dependent Clp protease ATP-binding subunit ClpA